ncbi:MAG: MarR family winged helix-turn-helix transcriptional regulator [Candidatus Dormibacteria bacterium]
MPTNHETAESLLRELRHLHDEVEALIRGPRPDQIADQDMVSGRQGHALYLIKAGAQGMGQLAAGLGISPAAATAVADRLVELGLAERARSGDRRVVQLQATERGLGLIRDRNVWEGQAIWALTRALEQVEAGRAQEAVSTLLQILGTASDDAGGPTVQPSGEGSELRSLLSVAVEEDAVSAIGTAPSAWSD